MSSSSTTSTSGAWLDRAKVMANQAAEATKKAATYAAEVTKTKYDELRSPPSSVECLNCHQAIAVPLTLFDWNCVNNHHNTRDAAVCVACALHKPKSNVDPTVTCTACQSSTPVPSSNASKHFKNAATSTKEFVAKSAQATREQIKYLGEQPSTFHCQHCNSLLAVPQGAWACQTCTAENAESIAICTKCSQKKSDQKAICGVCRASTNIPTSNLLDGLRATTTDLSKSSKKVYYDLRNVPYVSCSRCGNHVPLTERPNSAGAGASSAATSTIIEPGSGAEGAAPTVAQQQQLQGLVCSSCKNPVA